ncbi:MAG: hypothetical protein U9R53_04340 [Chloroflexota bacterium]|nr:hypothetical protein [Chloroflexota bacterium]
MMAFERKLNHFDEKVRESALRQIAQRLKTGEITTHLEMDVVNMHCHSFFSFNGYGYSPSALAWLAKKEGYKAIGIVDFDTLDGVNEFLQACEILDVRGSTGIETRSYFPEFSDRVINSPGEPGVSYVMGVGFSSSLVPDESKSILEDMQKRAMNRNKVIIERVNAFLSPVTVDYEDDVMTLTPGGNVTERHIVKAYILAARKKSSDVVKFWSEKLDLSNDEVINLLEDLPRLQNVIRRKLMKKGGVGYIEPTADSFPLLEDVNKLIISCGAIPCIAWLDGTTQGEMDAEELFSLQIDKGAAVLNIIPDRNWNIKDEKIKKQKLNNLYETVMMAKEFNLPLNVGTEMNRYDSPKIDGFDSKELVPLRKDFLDGAAFIYGHTVMQRTLGLGYQSGWTKAQFPNQRDRNQFYMKMGYRIPPGMQGTKILHNASCDEAPDYYLGLF